MHFTVVHRRRIPVAVTKRIRSISVVVRRSSFRDAVVSRNTIPDTAKTGSLSVVLGIQVDVNVEIRVGLSAKIIRLDVGSRWHCDLCMDVHLLGGAHGR